MGIKTLLSSVCLGRYQTDPKNLNRHIKGSSKMIPLKTSLVHKDLTLKFDFVGQRTPVQGVAKSVEEIKNIFRLCQALTTALVFWSLVNFRSNWREFFSQNSRLHIIKSYVLLCLLFFSFLLFFLSFVRNTLNGNVTPSVRINIQIKTTTGCAYLQLGKSQPIFLNVCSLKVLTQPWAGVILRSEKFFFLIIADFWKWNTE